MSWNRSSAVGLAGAAAAVGVGVGVAVSNLWRKQNSWSLDTSIPNSISRLLKLDHIFIDWTNTEEVMSAFIKAFDPLAEAFIASVAEFGIPEKFLQRIRRMLRYNVIGGKCNRGIVLVSNTRLLCKHQGLDFSKCIGPAIVLGWCVEILQASFLVADDVMDNSITRRGQPCWFRNQDVKLDAVNDSLILESFVFWCIKSEFGRSQESIIFGELFREVTFKTEIGQMMDLMSQPQDTFGPQVLKNFSSELLKHIVDYKTAFYTFYTPIACSMVLTGFRKPSQLLIAKQISCLLGEMFQAQDDYLDCFGDPAHIGKIGTDIQDHKCTWLVVHALERCSPEQRLVIENNLGRQDDQCVEKIKALYRDLGLPEVYAQYEQRTFEQIQSTIHSNAAHVPTVAFDLALKLTHKRSK